MKVSELKRVLDFAQEEDELVIAVNLPYVTVGGQPVITVESASSGFDWNRGKFILFPKENVTPSDRDFEANYNQPIAQPLNEMFTNKNVLKDAYDTWLKADISSFNWKADTVSFTKIPTDLNVEVKTTDENIVTKRNLYTTRTPDCC